MAILLTALGAVLAGLALGWALWRWRKGPGGRARALRSELDLATATLSARKLDLDAAERALSDARHEVDATAALLGRTTEDRRGLEVELRAVRTRLLAADATVAALRASLATVRADHAAARTEGAAARVEMERLRAAHDGLRATLAEIERDRDLAVAEARAARCERDRAHQAHDTAVRELASLEERVEAHRRERDTLLCRRMHLEAEMAEHRSAALEAENRVTAAEAEAQRITHEFAGLLLERDALAGDRDELERELEALRVIDLREPAGEQGAAGERPTDPEPGRPAVAGDDLKVVPGIGPVTEAMLRANGIRTYTELAALDDATLDRLAVTVPVLADRSRRTAWVAEAARLASVLVGRRG